MNLSSIVGDLQSRAMRQLARPAFFLLSLVFLLLLVGASDLLVSRYQDRFGWIETAISMISALNLGIILASLVGLTIEDLATKLAEIDRFSNAYSQLAVQRGRDFFGPILQETPAEEVLFLVEVLSTNLGPTRSNMTYRLSCEIVLERPLRSGTLLQIGVLPVVAIDGKPRTYYRNQIPETSSFTFDLMPILEFATTDKSGIENRMVKDILRGIDVECRSLPGSSSKRPGSTAGPPIEVSTGDPNHTVTLPCRDVRLPNGLKSFTVRTGEIPHPLDWRVMQLATPIRTRKLSLAYKCHSDNVMLEAARCMGEGARVTQGRLPNNHRARDDGAIIFDQSWSGEDWLIMPADYLQLFLSFQENL